MEDNYEIVDQIDDEQIINERDIYNTESENIFNQNMNNEYKIHNYNNVDKSPEMRWSTNLISSVKSDSSVLNDSNYKNKISENKIVSLITNSHNTSILKSSSMVSSSSVNTTIRKVNKSVNKSINKSINKSNASFNVMTVGNVPQNSISFGERLYRKSLAIKEVTANLTKENLSISMSKEKEKVKDRKLSYTPKLTDRSMMISLKKQYETYNTENLYRDDNYDSNNSSMSQFYSTSVGKKKREIISYQKQKEEKEMKELKPSKKKTAKEIDEITEKLYREANTLKVTKKQEADKIISDYCTFTPKIQDSSKPKVSNFYKRLQTWIEKRNDKYVQEIEQSNLDSKTGQVLFTPIIYKKKNEKHQPQPRNIFIDLYEESKKFTQNKQEIQIKNEEEISKMANSRKATNKIEEIHITQKFQSFIKLFEFFDIDKNDLLNFNDEFRLNISKLDEDLRKILEPMLNELSAFKESIDRDNFITVLDQFYNLLNVDQKRKLIDWHVIKMRRENSPRKRRYDKNQSGNNFTFRPNVNKKSNQVFEKSQKHSKDLLTRNSEFLKNKNEFIKSQLEEKKKNETKGCTFKPNAPVLI